ncbi:synaptophysin-like protein 1 [Pezoporus wallicus]|uniref:synaptophysin-like protein 1 n=1 Tax=Pezoporus wallicus TaxID=35540 RepID=UPI00254CC0E8|nr:synaptophysin-like protein 1 [Pezoporus wallicus]XP_061299077.1 synaptophysin-like protein 1 [Pezoporus flaviventris]
MAAPRWDLGPAREPLGLIRALQGFFSVFAFATLGGFQGSVSFHLSCAGSPNISVSAPFAYPFRLNLATFTPSLTALCNRTWARDVHLVGDFSSSAQFFVVVAVFSFLYSLGALLLYLGYLHLYRGAGGKLPLGDFLATAAFSFLWLVASSAWAKALTDVKASVAAPLPYCHPPAVICSRDTTTPMGTLNVSVVFGFLNLILWLGSSWFVFKETNFHTPPAPSTPSTM